MVVLDADVATSTRTAAFGQAFPDRFFNVGVAEANMIDIAAGLADRLAQSNIGVDLLEMSTLKPIDKEALIRSVRKTGKVLTVEEHTVYGGLRGAVAEVLSEEFPVPIASIGIQDCFGESGEYVALLRKHNLSADHIEARARAVMAT